MGVVQKQAGYRSIVNLIGSILGFVNITFIVPHVIEIYGLYTFIFSTASLMVPFAQLGMQGVAVKFFPEVKDEKNGHNGFLLFLILAVTLSCITVLLILLPFSTKIIKHYEEINAEYVTYLFAIIPLLYSILLYNVVTTYISNFKKIIVPAILKTSLKIVLPISLLLFLSDLFTIHQFIYFTVFYQFITVAGLFIYLAYLKELKLSLNTRFFNKAKIGKILNYAFFILLGNIGVSMAANIDIFMVGTMLNYTTETTIYAIGNYMAKIVLIPSLALLSIAGPLISEYHSKNQLDKIADLYSKSSMNLLVIGVLIFIGILASVDDLLIFMGNTEILLDAKYVMLLLGLGYLFSMATSLNQTIISYSKYYRALSLIVILVSVVNIIMNIFFIKMIGLLGAAVSTCASLILYNFVLWLYVKIKFNMNPFNVSMFIPILIGFALYMITQPINMFHSFVNIAIKSAFISIAYITSIYYLGISKDFNGLIDSVLLRLKTLLRIS